MTTTNKKITRDAEHRLSFWLTQARQALSKHIFFPLNIAIVATLLAEATLAQNENDNESSGADHLPPPSLFSKMKAVANTLTNEERVWLGEGEEQILAAYRPALKDQGLTGIIFLSSAGQALDRHPLIRSLRRELANHNWPTLVIQMPEPPGVNIPVRTLPPGGPSAANIDTTNSETSNDAANTDEAANTETDEGKQDYVNLASQRIAISTAAMRDRGSQQIVVVAEGQNAAIALRVLSDTENSNANVVGLVMLAATNAQLYDALSVYLPKSDTEQNTSNSNTAKSLAIVDYSNSALSIREMQERRRLLVFSGVAATLDMPRLLPTEEANLKQVEKRLRGWLNKLAAPRS